MHQSLAKRFPLFILASSVCWSLHCLISALTKGVGAKVVTSLGSLVQSCCGDGGTLQTNITGMCGECSQCFSRTGFAPTHGMCVFMVYTSQALGCSAGELSQADPGLRALPRSKLLRFRFSGIPQRHRLSWACVYCPSQAQAAQANRCLVIALSHLGCASYHLPGPSPFISWVHLVSALSGGPCISPLGS